MADTILGLLHNMKDYEHYDGQPFKLQKEEKDMLIAFLEQKDVQKCIPKVPVLGRFSPSDHYLCPSCRKVLDWNSDRDNICSKCGQKIKWMEDNNEKKSNIGSSIFDNFNVNTNNK